MFDLQQLLSESEKFFLENAQNSEHRIVCLLLKMLKADKTQCKVNSQKHDKDRKINATMRM